MNEHRFGRRLHPRVHRAMAWGVHVFTAFGAVLGMLALDAVARGAWRESLGLMAVTCLIDGVDGTMARWFRVKEVVPEIDGALLDNIVDYLNYALVPAYFLFRAHLLPGKTEALAAGVILMTSCYQFSQADAKTDDHYFKGFPCYWNIAVLYLLVGKLPPQWNLGVILACGVLVFVPIKYIYPSRTRRLQDVTLTLTTFWAAMMVAIVMQVPDPPSWLVRASFVYVVYYVVASLYLNLVGGHDGGDGTLERI